MATVDESALRAEIQKLDAEGREAERKLRDLEYQEKSADGTFKGYDKHIIHTNYILYSLAKFIHN